MKPEKSILDETRKVNMSKYIFIVLPLQHRNQINKTFLFDNIFQEIYMSSAMLMIKANIKKSYYYRYFVDYSEYLAKWATRLLNNLFPSQLIFCTRGAAEETSSEFAWIFLKITILIFNKTLVANYAWLFCKIRKWKLQHSVTL